MAKTLSQAAANWARKTQGAGGRWKAGTAGKGGDYARGLAEFLGSTPSQRVVSNWESGVGAVSESEFNSSIAGREGKYAENLRRALTS